MKQTGLRYLIFESVEHRHLTTLKTAMVLLGLVFSILVNTGAIAISNPWLATTVSFVTVFVLPGFLLSSLVFGRGQMSWPERLPVSFALGVGTLSLPGVLLLILHSSLDVLGWISMAINVILGGLCILHFNKKLYDCEKPYSTIDKYINPILLIVFIISNFLVVYMFISTASIWPFGDAWSYLLYIRRYLDLPLTTVVTSFPRTSAASVRAVFNVWCVLQAFMDRVAGVDPVEIYSFYLPPLLLVVSLLAFYSLAKELFKSRNAALFATLLQVLYCVSSIGAHDWIGRGFFDRIIQDKFLIWLVILPVTILLMLKYLSTGKRKHLLPLALSAAALSLTHPMGLVQCGISFASFALVHLLFNLEREKMARFMIIFTSLVLFFLIPLVQRQMVGTMEGSLFDYAAGTETQFNLSRTRLLIFSSVENKYMAHPQLIEHPLTILAILLTPLLIPYIRKSVAAQFLFSNMAIPLLVLYNPVTAPLLGRLITPWMLWRVTWVLPVSLTVGFLLHKIVQWVQRPLLKISFLVRKPHFLQVMPVLAVVLMVIPLQGHIADGLNVLKERKNRAISQNERALLIHMREHIAPESVIMAEPSINTYIPVFTSAARVLTFRVFAHPLAKEDIDRFYNARLVNDSVLDILERWNARYLVIEREHELAFQFSLLPSMFTRLYRNAGYELYEVLPDPGTNPIIAGNSHLVRGEWGEAVAKYNKALDLNPDDTLAHFGLGKVYLALGESEQAEAAFLDAIHAEVYNVLARTSVAQVYLAQGRVEEAIRQYEEAIRLCPDHLALHEGLGDIYLMQGRGDEAVAEYEKAIGLVPGTADYHSELGFFLHSKGLGERAIREYLKAIDLGAYSWLVYYQLGTAYLGEERLEEALYAYKQAIKIEPDYIMARVGIGHVHKAQGQIAEAITQYRSAIDVNPHAANAYLALGNLYKDQGEIGEAITVYQQAIAMQPECVSCYCRLGEAYEARGESEQAIAEYQQAIEVDPDSATPYVLLGNLYRDLGGVEVAIEAYERAVALHSDSVHTYEALGKLYEEQGRVEEAVAIYKQATDVQPDRSDPHVLLGKLYGAQGNVKAAIEEYERAIEIDPDSAAPYVALGDLYRKEKRLEEALTSYREAVMLNPNYMPGHIRLGAVYKALGDPEKALTVYQQAMAVDPDNQALWKAFPPLSDDQPMRIKLGDSVRFLGYAADSAKVEANGSLQLTFYWQGLEKMDTSYTVFVHLLGANGRFWGQEDTPPCQADCPTISWPLETVITDEHEITIDPQTPPGEYVLEMGMYDVATGERLGAYDEQLREWLPEARILLGKVVVR